MDKGKVGKAAAIVIAVLVTVLSLLHTADWHAVGIYARCPMPGRLLYPFFHSGFVHAALNAWCLLSITFIYDVSCLRMALAYVVAVAVPVDTLEAFFPPDCPTVGLSGVVYVLFGSISFEVARRAYFQLWMLYYLGLGFILPGTNAWLHLYCYLCGLVFALLNRPINRKP